MEMLIYLGYLTIALASGGLGAFIGLIPKRANRAVDRLLSVTLYLLLFSMGIRTGLIEEIGNKLGQIGLLSFFLAAAAALGSIIFVLIGGFVYKNARNINSEEKDSRGFTLTRHTFLSLLRHLKEPGILVLIVVAGGLLSALTPLFSWFRDSVSEWLLYGLLFFVGVQMVNGEVKLGPIFRNPAAVSLPLLTALGSLAGSLLLSLFIPLTPGESMAVGAGFGWYSLSGILIADLGNPVLGSIAFLSNLFRESIAFITIPLLAGYGMYRESVSVCGATSMDVTLPMVEKHCGITYVPISLAHGIILSVIVPFLVPLLYNL